MGAVFCRLGEVDRAIRHEMKGEEFHDAASAKKERIKDMVCDGRSTCGRCPQSGMEANCSCGNASIQAVANATGSTLSSFPQISFVGTLIRWSQR